MLRKVAAEAWSGLGFSCGSSQFVEGALVLLELLASFSELTLSRQPLVLLKLLDGAQD